MSKFFTGKWNDIDLGPESPIGLQYVMTQYWDGGDKWGTIVFFDCPNKHSEAVSVSVKITQYDGSGHVSATKTLEFPELEPGEKARRGFELAAFSYRVAHVSASAPAGLFRKELGLVLYREKFPELQAAQEADQHEKQAQRIWETTRGVVLFVLIATPVVFLAATLISWLFKDPGEFFMFMLFIFVIGGGLGLYSRFFRRIGF